MPLPSNITDPNTKHSAFVNHDAGEDHGLVVATRPLKTFENSVQFFTNPTYGLDMNISFTINLTETLYEDAAGAPGEWDYQAITGGGNWVFDTASPGGTTCPGDDDANHVIDATATVNNDTMELYEGGTFDLSNYDILRIWVYLTAWDDRGTKDIQVYGYDTGTGTQIGNTINLRDFINIAQTNVWQSANIPLADYNLNTQSVTGFRITTIDLGPGSPPDYYLDMIQLLGDVTEGGIVDFTIEPDPGTWLHVSDIDILMVDAYAGTLADGTMPSLPYDSFLGVSALTNGVLYQRVQDGEVRFSLPFRQLSDFLIMPGMEVADSGSDGTNTWALLRVNITEPLVLKSEDHDLLRFRVSDDLSDFLLLRMSAGCRIEHREDEHSHGD